MPQILLETRVAPGSVPIPLELVVQSWRDGLIAFDERQRVSLANESARNLLGLPLDTLLGRSAHTLWYCPTLEAESAGDIQRQFSRLFARAADFPALTVALRGSGRELSLQLFPICDGSGRRRGTGLTLRDCTREREIGRRKDELVSMITHELRTPLTSILGFSDLLLTREFPEAQQRQMLETIYRESRRLTALLNDFLNLRRLESGYQALRLSTFPLSDLAAEVSAGFELSRSKHQLRLALPPDLPPIRGDRDRLGQALRNLLDNAFKYSPQGGPVTIAARVVGQHEALYVTVSDEGLGLPAEAIPRLFQCFYRVSAPDRQEIAGTGLGLAIVEQIITAHEGRVWAESAGPGRGSTFGFALPLNAAHS